MTGLWLGKFKIHRAQNGQKAQVGTFGYGLWSLSTGGISSSSDKAQLAPKAFQLMESGPSGSAKALSLIKVNGLWALITSAKHLTSNT